MMCLGAPYTCCVVRFQGCLKSQVYHGILISRGDFLGQRLPVVAHTSPPHPLGWPYGTASVDAVAPDAMYSSRVAWHMLQQHR